jgi:hypothetical protein
MIQVSNAKDFYWKFPKNVLRTYQDIDAIVRGLKPLSSSLRILGVMQSGSEPVK